MKARRIRLLLMLLASHALLFVLARSYMAAGKPSAAADAAASAGGMPLKAKSEARGERTANYPKLLAELAASKLSWEDYKTAQEELFREWIQRDLHGAMDVLYGPETRAIHEYLADDLREDLKEEILRQPLAVWEWMLDGRYGSGRPKVYGLWLEALVLGGESKLALQLMEEGPKIQMTDSLEHICSEGDAEQIKVGRELLMQFEVKARHRDHYSLIDSYATRKLDLARGDALVSLQDESDAQIREKIAEAWITRELRLLPAEAAAAKLKELPEDVRGAAVEELVSSERRGGYEGMVELLGAIDREGLWQEHLRYDPDGWLDKVTLEDLAGQQVWSFLDGDEPERDPNRIIGELSRIGNPGVRGSAFGRAAEAIYRSGRDDELLDLVDGMPEGRDHDAILEGLLQFLDRDSESYPAIRERLSDEALKRKYARESPDSE